MTNNTNSATVDTLTAEVRVLMVGNRQITQSVAKQLDTAPYEDVEPFGRIKLNGKDWDSPHYIHIIGKHKSTGELVTAKVPGVRLFPVNLSDFAKSELPIAPNSAYQNRLKALTPHGEFDVFTAEIEGQSIYFYPGQVRDSRIWVTDWELGKRSAEIIYRAQKCSERMDTDVERFSKMDDLPLIVLAGLR